MNKRKAIISSSAFIAISLICVGVWFLNKNIYPLWNANTFNITAEQPIDKEKIKIYFGISVNSINRENDLDLFTNMGKYTILYDGIKKGKMINDYGENDFFITYDNSYYFSFRQFKTYWRAQHTYNINVKEQEGIPFLQVEIKGHTPMKFSRPMIAIKDADKYRCNIPKEKAGVVYNMVELVDK